MLVRALLMVALLVGGYFFVRWLRCSPWLARVPQLLVTAGVVGFLVLLTVRGGAEIAVPLLAVAAPFLLRWFNAHPLSSSAATTGSGRSGQSIVVTRFLRMTLDHVTGVMSGMVREGCFAERSLRDLSLWELLTLWRECQADPQSIAVLEAYLDRHADPAWRDRLRDDDRSGWTAGAASARSGHMDRMEAYEILGLQPGASREEIQAAYRRLIQRLHPDQGGTAYLAASLNWARDLLLRGLNGKEGDDDIN